MVAAGNAHGEVTIFQIQKELPTELATHEIAASLITSKPIERYTIKDACRSIITSLEWSKNGMKLFSGDSNGVVVLTELDFGQHISKSVEVINEKFGIVQMQFCSPWLLISTLYRAIVCKKDESNQWKVSQIGRTDRKVLNDFGAVFTPIDVNHRKPPSIICARPGFRFWLADVDGNVSHTFLLKDSVHQVRSIVEVPLLNPVHNKIVHIKDTYFGPCFYFMGKFIVTYCESMVFIVNVDKLKVMATIKRLRKIQYLTVNGNEIFIVEGGRSIVRLSIVPEHSGIPGTTQYVPLNNNNLMLSDPNIEIQEETVTQADECFELPPIENIRLDIPLSCRIGEHHLLKEDKLLLEHSRKLEVFEKINTLDYDDSILFHTGTKKKKKTSAHSSSSDEARIDGVVEIGRQAEFLNHDHTNGLTQTDNEISDHVPEIGSFNAFTTKPCFMLASFCDGVSHVQDTPTRNGETKSMDAESMASSNETLASHDKPSPRMSKRQFKPLEFNYPIYPVASNLSNGCENEKNIETNGSQSNETPLTEVPLTSDDDEDDPDTVDSLNAIKQCANNRTPIQSPTDTSKPIPSTAVDPKQIKYHPSLANLPKLWDINIEKCDDQQYNGDTSHSSNGRSSTKEGIDSEWVFL